MQELNRRCHDDTCQEAADRAVKKVFAILGVDVDKPESVEEFREDLRFGWKIKLSHNGTLPSDRAQDRIKGSVFRVTPWKAI